MASMATSLNNLVPTSSSCSLNMPYSTKIFSSFPCCPFIRFSHSLAPVFTKSRSIFCRKKSNSEFSVKAQTLDFSGSFFEGGFGSDDDSTTPGPGFTAVEEKEEPQCPPGLRQYETMAVLRPDMSEDERLALTQKYEELLVAGGGMYVEVFNRGVIPLAYSIKKKNRAGETNTYLDGIYLLFTYFTKPESIDILEETLKADDNVIRSMTSKPCRLDLTLQFLDKLPKISFDEELRSRDSQCCVCLGEFEMKEELLQIPYCRHVFHVDCIQHWLQSNSTCPLCRCSIIPTTKFLNPPPPQHVLQQEEISITSNDIMVSTLPHQPAAQEDEVAASSNTSNFSRE